MRVCVAALLRCCANGICRISTFKCARNCNHFFSFSFVFLHFFHFFHFYFAFCNFLLLCERIFYNNEIPTGSCWLLLSAIAACCVVVQSGYATAKFGHRVRYHFFFAICCCFCLSWFLFFSKLRSISICFLLRIGNCGDYY